MGKNENQGGWCTREWLVGVAVVVRILRIYLKQQKEPLFNYLFSGNTSLKIIQNEVKKIRHAIVHFNVT